MTAPWQPGLDSLGAAIQRSKMGNLTNKAFMGDQQAMGTLMGMSPQTAMMVQQQQGMAGKRSRQQMLDDLNREKFQLEKDKFANKLSETDRVQSSEYIPGTGFSQLTRGGKASLVKLPEEDRLAIEEALEEQAKRKAEAAGMKEKAISDVEIGAAATIAKEKKLGMARAKVGEKIGMAAQTAARSRPKVVAIRQALNAIDTGKLSQVGLYLGQFIPGIDVSDEQLMQSQITKFVLDTLNEQSGTKTDFDFKKAEEASASFGKTTEGNKKILDILIRNLDATLEEANQFNLYDKEGKDPLKFTYKPVKKASKKAVSKMSEEEMAEHYETLSDEELMRELR